MAVPIGRIQPVKSVACPKCQVVLSENALLLALQGKAVRCARCRMEIRLSEETRELIRKSRARS